MMGFPWAGGGWGGFLGSGLMFLFWIAIVGLIVWAVTAATRSGGRREPGPAPSALDIARARYARGEISREEYDQLRKDLA